MSYIGSSKIGKMPIGSTGIQKTYLGSDLVYRERLPSGYTELQYVTTDSNAYIDTGISGATDLEIYTEFYVNNYIQYAAIYGNWEDDNHVSNRAILLNQTALYVAGGANGGTQVNNFTIGAKHSLNVTSQRANLDGVNTALQTASLTANNNNICLGNRSLTNPTTRDIGLRLYSFSIRKNGVRVANYIPCKRDSDSAIGFYDFVSDSFKPSDTSTPFVAGPELS